VTCKGAVDSIPITDELRQVIMSFQYMLRFAIQPGFREDERLENLVKFCRAALIDEVMFFVNCEELNQGHLTREETQPWLEVIAKGKRALTPLGIAVSINPWTTLLGADRGRTLKPGQNFQLMQDIHGRSAGAQVCPRCPEWRRYISDMYACYATLAPHMLWVEDDFRLHNHAPLGWGGCFCKLHMEEYSRRIGRTVTRAEFIEGVLLPGKPHPFRKIWLDVGRETMKELAALIGNAVHHVAPDTTIGLMCSLPAVHCAEGRDWAGILDGFSNDRSPAVLRPHLPAYWESAPGVYCWEFNQVTRMTEACVPSTTRLYPELDSISRTRFAKSLAFTKFQIETSLLAGARGITLNIFDMMGGGVLWGEGWQKLLAGNKKFLTALADLGLSHVSQTGVRVLINPDASYTIQTDGENRMESLYPLEQFWAGYLSALGIANTFTTNIGWKRQVVAVSGQYLRGLDEETIKCIFKDNFIIMEGEAIWTLLDMGYGKLAGIRNVRRHAQDTGIQAYEEVCNGNAYGGIAGARISSQGFSGDYLEIEYQNPPLLKTMVKDHYGRTIGPGMAVIDGRVFVLPFGWFGTGVQPVGYVSGYANHLHPVKQEIIQEVMAGVDGYVRPVYAGASPYIAVYSFEWLDRMALAIVNCSSDDIEEVRLNINGRQFKNMMEIAGDHFVQQQADISYEHDDIILRNGLKRMTLKVLIMGK